MVMGCRHRSLQLDVVQTGAHILPKALEIPKPPKPPQDLEAGPIAETSSARASRSASGSPPKKRRRCGSLEEDSGRLSGELGAGGNCWVQRSLRCAGVSECQSSRQQRFLRFLSGRLSYVKSLYALLFVGVQVHFSRGKILNPTVRSLSLVDEVEEPVLALPPTDKKADASAAAAPASEAESWLNVVFSCHRH